MPLPTGPRLGERGRSPAERWDQGQPWLRRPPLLHPRFRCLPPPLIVIGMHRSGTSLVAAMLGALGVFMGPECEALTASGAPWSGAPLTLSGYGEAHDFLTLNDQLLLDAGAAWNHIDPFLRRRRQPAFARPRLVLLGLATFGRLRHRYLQSLPADFRGPWGWKDPRNSVTLPFWLHLFSEAQILHVRRDREAVIDSLHHRARVWQASPAPPLPLAQRAGRWVRHPGATVRRTGQRLGFLPPRPPDPCLDRGYCASLCDQYVRESLTFRAGGGRYQEVWYEEIVANPVTAAHQLAAFAGLTPSRSQAREAARFVRTGKDTGWARRPVPCGAGCAAR